MENVLVTGGAGFIGSNFINYILGEDTDYNIVNLDKLTYAGNLENLIPSESKKNYHFVKGDICNGDLVRYLFQKYDISYVINFAAESHVDRSILSSEVFFRSNVLGTSVLLETARKFSVKMFLQISTDEVYGSLGSEGLFTEETQLHPNSPYAASKASADLMALSFHRTYGLPVVITRCSNNYGLYQFPEKLIPLMIVNLIQGKKLPVYGDGMNVRDWIYVLDHNRAVHAVLENGRVGEIYNIGASTEIANIEIVKLLIKQMGKSDDSIEYVKDRPGHDKRYAIDSSKIKNELGWFPLYDFESAIKRTIEWYLNNKSWWERIITGEYRHYYKTQYS